MKEPKYVAETLASFSARRALHQDLQALSELPKGRRRDERSCPCGKATGLIVGNFRFGDDDFLHPLPYGVRRFTREFDSGLLPQYDEMAKP